MFYKTLYEKLIQFRKNTDENEICHIHHIIPKYQNGSNAPQNLVRLTISDHALAHWLLWKINRNLEDKIAYKMLSGKTKESEQLRRVLALQKLPIEDLRERFLINNPQKDPKNVKKAQETKKLKYNGAFFSEEGLKKISKVNKGKKFSKEVIEKSKLKQKEFLLSLTKKERCEIYGRPSLQNGNFGKKRPGKLAGNFGTSKGYYIIKNNKSNHELKFNSLKEAMDYGFDEGTLKRKRNTSLPIKQGKWAGYIIEYIENKEYGKAYNNHKNKYG